MNIPKKLKDKNLLIKAGAILSVFIGLIYFVTKSPSTPLEQPAIVEEETAHEDPAVHEEEKSSGSEEPMIDVYTGELIAPAETEKVIEAEQVDAIYSSENLSEDEKTIGSSVQVDFIGDFKGKKNDEDLINVIDAPSQEDIDAIYREGELKKAKEASIRSLIDASKQERAEYLFRRRESIKKGITFSDPEPKIPIFNNAGEVINPGELPPSIIVKAKDLKIVILDSADENNESTNSDIETEHKDASKSEGISETSIESPLENLLDSIEDSSESAFDDIEDEKVDEAPTIDIQDTKNALDRALEEDEVVTDEDSLESNELSDPLAEQNAAILNAPDNGIIINLPKNSKKENFKKFIPEGEMLELSLFNNLATATVDTIAIAFTTKDFLINGEVAIPRGTKVLGTYSPARNRNSIAIKWHTLVFTDRKSISIDAVGMDIKRDNGVAGIVVPTKAWKTVLPLLANYVSVYQGARVDFEVGETDEQHLSNESVDAHRQAIESTANKAMDMLVDEFSQERPYVVVLAGTRSFAYLKKSINPDKREYR